MSNSEGGEYGITHDLSQILNTSSSTGQSRKMHHVRRRLSIVPNRIVSHFSSKKYSAVGLSTSGALRLAQDKCNSVIDICCWCTGVTRGDVAHIWAMMPGVSRPW